MSYPNMSIDQAKITRDADARLREQFATKSALNHPIRSMFFQEGSTARDFGEFVQWGALPNAQKMQGSSGHKFASINAYKRTVELQPYGVALQINEWDYERLAYAPGFQEGLRDTAGSMGVMLSNLWERFLHDALTGGTTYLGGAVKSPDGTISTVFDTTGHYGGNVINAYDGGTSFSSTTIRADQKEIKNLATTVKDDKGEMVASLGTPSFTYLVPSDRAEEYAQALEAPLVGLAPYTTSPGSLGPVAAVTNMLPQKNRITVMEWGRLNADSPEVVYVLVDYGQTGTSLVSGPPFEMVTWNKAGGTGPRLQYMGPDARNPEHLWVGDWWAGVRLVRPACIMRIDKAA